MVRISLSACGGTSGRTVRELGTFYVQKEQPGVRSYSTGAWSALQRGHAKMATRAVLQTFEKYQKERVAFVTAVAEMAKNPQVRVSSKAASLLLALT